MILGVTFPMQISIMKIKLPRKRKVILEAHMNLGENFRKFLILSNLLAKPLKLMDTFSLNTVLYQKHAVQ